MGNSLLWFKSLDQAILFLSCLTCAWNKIELNQRPAIDSTNCDSVNIFFNLKPHFVRQLRWITNSDGQIIDKYMGHLQAKQI